MTVTQFDKYNIGDVVTNSAHFWQIPFAGCVVAKQLHTDGTGTLTVERASHAVSGDKFTTLHGQKGVITILSDSAMPRVGKFVPELIIGSSSIIKRTTPSQVIEAAASM